MLNHKKAFDNAEILNRAEMVHKMHRNISSWISKNAHQSQIRFKVSLTARSLKQIFVFSLDVNILCLPWKGNEIRTSHGIERGENLYSNWRTGFGYLWNFWDSWYFYWIFGSIDFFLFLWLFGEWEWEAQRGREGERGSVRQERIHSLFFIRTIL